MAVEFRHDPAGQKFFVVGREEDAVLAYTEVNSILDIHTIQLPDDLRGEGVAEELVLFAFHWAKEHGYKIIPTCPYVRDHFLKRHPEWQELVVEDYF